MKDSGEKLAMKHGVIIREHKHWNTKTVYNKGCVMRIYRHCPKVIRFTSPMVNDFNQHLCGGWAFADIADDAEATIKQLIEGKKPFGTLGGWHRPPHYYHPFQERLRTAGLDTTLQKKKTLKDGSQLWHLLACHRIKVKDIGSLSLLAEDYLNAEAAFLDSSIPDYEDKMLREFFGGWNEEDIPLWLVGLILGYPIENTISIYLQDRVYDRFSTSWFRFGG
jgi:hypothetical protein